MTKYKWTHLDQIDGMYEGMITKDFKREGFGIFMDDNFDTYFGNWSNNQMHGLGLVVFKNGGIMYAVFNRNVPNSLRVVKQRDRLLVGTFANNKLNGIGFQYRYESFMWIMNKYKKGEIVEEMGREQDKTMIQPPGIMTIEQSIYKICESFIRKDVFKNKEELHYLKEDIVEKIGIMIDGKQEGLGLIINKHRVIEAGQYYNGHLDGLGFILKQQHQQIGYFVEGQRDGIIQIINHHHQQKTVFKYKNDLQIKQLKTANSHNTLKNFIRQKRQLNPNFISQRLLAPLRQLKQQIYKPIPSLKLVIDRLQVPKPSKSLLRSKPTKIQTPRNRYFKYQTFQSKKSRQQQSCVDYIRRTGGVLLGGLHIITKDEDKTNDDEIAQEYNPLA